MKSYVCALYVRMSLYIYIVKLKLNKATKRRHKNSSGLKNVDIYPSPQLLQNQCV